MSGALDQTQDADSTSPYEDQQALAGTQPQDTTTTVGNAAPAPAPAPQLQADGPIYQQAMQVRQARQQAEADHKAFFQNAQNAQLDESDVTSFAPTSSGSKSAMHDFGDRLWAATLQTGQAALGVASFAANKLTGDPAITGYIEQQKANIADHVQKTLDDLSPQGKLALQASIFHPGGQTDAQGNETAPSIGEAGWGRYLAGAAADAIPQLALAVLPGGIAVQVAKVAAFGALDAGGAYNEMVKKIDDAKPSELQSSPVYAHLREQGVGDVEARRELLAQVAPAMVAEHFGVGAAAGAGLGGMVSGKLIPSGASLIRRALVGAGEGAATTGGQAAGDEAVSQRTDQQLTGKPLDSSQVGIEAAKGALGGALLGAGAGVLHGGGHADTPAVTDPTEAPAAKPVTLPADVSAAVTEALPKQSATASASTGAPSPSTPAPTSAPVNPAVAEQVMNPPGSQPATPPSAEAQAAAKPAPAPAPTPAPTPAPEASPTVVPQAAPAPAATPVPEPARAFTLTPAPASAPEAAGEVRAMPNLGAAGKAIGANLRDMLWDKFQRGETAEAGLPSNVLLTAQANASKIPDRATFDQFLNAYAARGKPAANKPVTPEPAAVSPEPAPVTPAPEPVIPEAPQVTPTPPAASAAPAAPVTKADQMRARRAAQKARMAETSGPIKGAGYVAEGEATEPAAPTPSAEPAPRTREDAMGDLRDAANTVGTTKVKKLSKDTDIAKVMGQVMAQVGKRIDPKDNSAEGVHAALQAWSDDAPTAKIPGTSTTREDVAQGMMSLMTRPAERQARLAIEARAEAGRQASVYEDGGAASRADLEASHARDVDRENPTTSQTSEEGTEHAASEPVADAGTGDEGASQGVSNYSDGEKERSEATTDRARIAEDHLQRVLEGRTSPREAAETFDWLRENADGSKRAGREPRAELKTFAGFLDKKIADLSKRLEDPKERERQLKLLTDTQGDSALRRDVLREMKETSPDRLRELQDARRELTDPVGHAVVREGRAQRPAKKSEAKPPARLARVFGLDTPASRFVRASKDPGLARNIAASIAARPQGLHDILHMIERHPGSGEFQPLRELATRLREVAPNIEVLSPEHAIERGYINSDDAHETAGLSGYYQPGYNLGGGARVNDHIVINGTAGRDTPVTVLHEALHLVTAGYIAKLQRGDPNGREMQAFNLIGRELRDYINANPHAFSKEEINAADYALTSQHELHTMMMSEPALQSAMSRIPASDGLRANMARLGFAPREAGTSLWRHFADWTRRALGLDPNRSASAQTLFDHVMGPSVGVIDNAHAYNRLMGRAPEQVQAMGRPVFDATGAGRQGRVRDLAETALRSIDVGGLSDRMRAGLLQGATSDAITKWVRDTFRPSDRLAIGGNPLDRFRAAQEAISATVRRIYGKMGAGVSDLTTRLSGRTELAQLMNDATLQGVHLGTEDASKNAGEADDAKRDAEWAALQRRFDALSPADRKTYEDVRDHYTATNAAERTAQRASLVGQALPDATPAQVEALAKVTRSQKSIDEFLKNPDDNETARAFGDAWQKSRELVRGIAKIQRIGFVSGDYFPLRRFGDYVVKYGDRNDPATYGVEMFERKADAAARRNELLRQNADGLSQVLDRRTSKLREIAPDSQVANDMLNAISRSPELRGQREQIADTLNAILLEHAARNSSMLSKARRKGVLGANLDAPRVLASEFIGHGVRMGYYENGAARAKALADMRLVADDLGSHGKANDQIRAQAVIHELEQRVAAQTPDGSALGGLARRASQLGFVQSLMSPSHMLTSSIEAHTMSAALLGARHGTGSAAAALARALADVSPRLLKEGFRASMKAMGKGLTAADWDLSRAARERLVANGADAGQMTRLFKAADDAGLINHTADRDLREIAQPGISSTTVGKYWGRFLDFNAAAAHAVDTANRSAILKAAFDLELRKSGSEAVAINHAIDMLRDAVPNYNASNKARITTNKGALGNFAAPLTQFKQYGIHMYGVIANLAHESLKNAPSAERREARKALAGILATHALMAGGLTIIADPLRLVGGIYDWMTGATHPHDYQNDVRNFLADTFGPEAGELISRGLPHALGIDLHHRVGLSNLLELPDLDSFDSKGLIKAVGTMAAGAAGQDAANMVQGATRLWHGDMGGFQDLVPRVLRDPLKAVALADNGVMDSRGRQLATSDQVGTGGVLAQALGFTPSVASEAREGQAAVREAQQDAKEARGKLISAWVAAGPGRADVSTQIRQFNQANPAQPITMPQLVNALAAQARARQQQPGANSFGLRLPPKGAALLARAGRFANVN